MTADAGQPQNLPAEAQAAQYPTFALHTLGWKAFQDLCLSVLTEVLGQTVQAFAPVRDGGRDGAFQGNWDSNKAPGVPGTYTFQCKFTSRTGVQVTLADLDEETPKATRLAASGKADNYIIVTNYSLTGPNEEEIRTHFLAIPGVKNCLVCGSEWLISKIRESPRLRMMVPRVYGLGDLSQILDERAYAQASIILSAMGADLSKFVITDPYKRAARALLDHGFVLLLGEPASGKSSIAAALSLGAIDLWNCRTMKLTGAQEFIEHWNPHEPRQFFWVDDAFGASHYQRDKVNEWNDVLPHVAAAARAGAKVLFTSRDYVYRAAARDIKGTAFPLMVNSQVVIEVQKLTTQEREQILYNHIKLGDQERAFKRRIKPHLPAVSSSQRFLPETARRLGNSLFTKNLALTDEGVKGFVEKPVDLLVDVIRGLDDHCLAALALVFMHGSALESPMGLTPTDEEVLQLMGSDAAGVRNSLNSLRGTLVELRTHLSGSRWAFRHPTVSDAMATLVVGDPELMDVYLAGTPLDRVLQEVSCGDVGIEGVKLILPESRFDAFARRLDTLGTGNQLYSFLSRRCSPSFLSFYLTGRDLAQRAVLAVRSYLSVASSVAFLARLRECGLLAEDVRRAFVERASQLVVSTPDADAFTDDQVRGLFTDEELDKLRGSIQEELIPNLDDVVSEWRNNWDGSEDPDSHFWLLDQAFHAFAEEFAGRNEEVESAFGVAQGDVDSVIEELKNEVVEPEVDFESIGEAIHPEPTDGDERSIFDDVDV